MGADPEGSATIAVPEVRDHRAINFEAIRLLDAGHTRVVLAGVEGQRLLLAGLSGAWRGVIEVEGRAGPELAADLDAPGLVVVARGGAGDGLARGIKAGVVIVIGPVGDAAGYGQRGGLVAVAGPAGHRAGLRQAGGVLALLGPAGRLAGDRQSGGRLLAGGLGPHAGHARTGGTMDVLPFPEVNVTAARLPRVLDAILRDDRDDLLRALGGARTP